AAAEYYRQRFPNHRHPDRRVVSQRTEQRLSECGSFNSCHKSGGARRLGHNTNTRTVSRILHENKVHPYSILVFQALKEPNHLARLSFWDWLLQQHDNDNQFTSYILWTDESVFIYHREELPSLLTEILFIIQKLIFQHDGAPPHFSRNIRQQ
ncbi:hypothetical protein WH47_05359, partial [Habropoda laboriosa]